MKCETCQRHLVKTRVAEYNYQERGVSNVFLGNIDVLECSACGSRVPIISRITELHEVMAEAFALKPTPLTGEEIRFIRKQLKLTAKEFARYIGIDHTVLSRWENNRKPPGRVSDRLVRLFYFRYMEEVQSRTFAKHILDDITANKTSTRIEVTFPSNNPALYSYSSPDDLAPA